MSKNINERMIKIVEEFKTHIIKDGKSTYTLQSYVGYISAFLKYLGTMGVEFDGLVKRFYITSYKNYLIDNSYEPATINKKVNSIGAFSKMNFQSPLGEITHRW